MGTKVSLQDFLSMFVDGKGTVDGKQIKKIYFGNPNFTKRELPSGYTQVEYIQSSGTQYIDTGFVPNQNTRIYAEAVLAIASSTQGLFGSRVSSSSSAFQFVTQGGYYRTDYNGTITNISSQDYGASKFYIDKNKNVTDLNGEYSHTDTVNSFTCPSNLYVFATNNNGTVYANATAKLYCMRIYDNGTLVRDFVPCKNASGTVGLYDIVNGVFYTDAAGGAFTAGATYGGVALKLKKLYIGEDGIARLLCKCGGELAYYGTGADLSAGRIRPVGVSVGKSYALFAGGNNTFNVDTYSASLVKGTAANLSACDNEAFGASVGNYGLIAGGVSSNYVYYSAVIAYNTNLTKSSPSNLSQAKCSAGGAKAGNHAIFAGGYNSDISGYHLKTVDAYSDTLVKKTCTALTTARSYFKGATAGNHALFGGGTTNSSNSAEVDAYSNTLVKKTCTALSTSREGMAGASVGDYAIFAGGGSGASTAYSTVDAYNKNLVKVSASSLSVSKQELAGASVEGYAIFAGGLAYPNYYNTAEAYDVNLVKITLSNMSAARQLPAGASVGDYAIFAGGQYKAYKYVLPVDVYTIA